MTSLFGGAAVSLALSLPMATHAKPYELLSTVAVNAPRASETGTSISTSMETIAGATTVVDRLLQARAEAKKLTSSVAMHIDGAWKEKLYRQIDSLLDPDEWMEGDEPLRMDSFQTFLRLMLQLNSPNKPGIGISISGELMATWAEKDSRLTVYCRSSDKLRYLVSHVVDGERLSHGGDATIEHLSDWIAPFQPERWFGRNAS